jgi:hypothetical protein
MHRGKEALRSSLCSCCHDSSAQALPDNGLDGRSDRRQRGGADGLAVPERRTRDLDSQEAEVQHWLRRIRGAIGIGLTWAAAWFGAGILLARVPGFYSDLPFALLFAPLGFVTGIIFSGILVVIERRRRFDRVSLSRFAGWGAVSGLLLSGIFVVAAPKRHLRCDRRPEQADAGGGCPALGAPPPTASGCGRSCAEKASCTRGPRGTGAPEELAWKSRGSG